MFTSTKKALCVCLALLCCIALAGCAQYERDIPTLTVSASKRAIPVSFSNGSWRSGSYSFIAEPPDFSSEKARERLPLINTDDGTVKLNFTRKPDQISAEIVSPACFLSDGNWNTLKLQIEDGSTISVPGGEWYCHVWANWEEKNGVGGLASYWFRVESSAPKLPEPKVSAVFNCLPLFAEYDIPQPNTFTIDDFPEATFSFDNETVFSPDGEALIKGFILNIFSYDVTGDGKNDICATTEIGSGNLITNVCVYDWANKAYYETNYNMGLERFLFSEGDDLLMGYLSGTSDNRYFFVSQAGKLVISDGILSAKSDDSLLPAATAVYDRSKLAVIHTGFYTRSLESLKELYPTLFGLDTTRGLTVYLNASKRYGILEGTDGVLDYEDYKANYSKYNQFGGPSFAEIRTILDNYAIVYDRVSFKPFYDPSSHLNTKEQTLEAIQRLFNNDTGGQFTLGDWLETRGF
ncbi:MAG: hypothetical protein IJM39_03920 [Firmicutes bacterium]|nr:hypothetical protein [Bacillota bacterium]